MVEIPVLYTRRLVLRPFEIGDAPVVSELAGDREIADMTIRIPYPYDEEMAEKWIETHNDQFKLGISLFMAVTLEEDGTLVGSVGLDLDQFNDSAELGYWIGKPYWRNGYATEAARAMLEYGFDVLDLNRIHAHCFSRNEPSAKVMERIGMVYEGRLRQHVRKWDSFEDISVFGILRDEFAAGGGGRRAVSAGEEQT